MRVGRARRPRTTQDCAPLWALPGSHASLASANLEWNLRTFFCVLDFSSGRPSIDRLSSFVPTVFRPALPALSSPAQVPRPMKTHQAPLPALAPSQAGEHLHSLGAQVRPQPAETAPNRQPRFPLLDEAREDRAVDVIGATDKVEPGPELAASAHAIRHAGRRGLSTSGRQGHTRRPGRRASLGRGRCGRQTDGDSWSADAALRPAPKRADPMLRIGSPALQQVSAA